MNLQRYPGYLGLFTRDHVEGAIPNGTRVVKVATEPGDAHPVGSRATVLGSMPVPPEVQLTFKNPAKFVYFVEWDNYPRVAVGVHSRKISTLAVGD